ncbi:MAG: hypothetical protein A2Y38_05080 [Spirochaetes bacterium GWB1_59_5]|nr:MAG: hypothetical protein A2Y38_05080 [Spirochaetes bacterium GWB1_59_5]
MRSRFLIGACLFAITALACQTCQASTQERTLLSYAKAASAYASGDLKTAAAAARESIGMSNDFLPAVVLLGKVSYFSGDDEAAVTALKRALRLSPRAGEAALWLSRAYRAAGRAVEARRGCELLLSTDPQNIAGLRLAACLALDLNDVAGARAYLNRAVESAGEAGLAFADRAALRWAAGGATGAGADLTAALVTLPEGSAARQATEELLERIAEAGR